MTRLATLWAALAAALDRLAPEALPLLARLVFAGVLAGYFWASAVTKLGDGIFSPSVGAYAQIFPRLLEVAGYDPAALGVFSRVVVVAGTWAEFVLPALIVLGLATRVAALGMIGFIAVQSITDIFGHLAEPETVGIWFDRVPDAMILDQRAFWVLTLLILLLQGAGRLSLDRVLQGLIRPITKAS